MRRAVLLALLAAPVSLAAFVSPGARAAAGETAGATTRPLLDLARQLQAKQTSDDLPAPGDEELRAAEHELNQAKAPPDADCARSLGATRFAALHLRVGNIRVGSGDFAGAAAAFRRAAACRPRDQEIRERLADAAFAAHDYAAARAAVQEGFALDPRWPELHRHAGNLDFVAGSWADAAARFRYVAASDESRESSEYAQLMYWLAQRHAGVPEPQFVRRAHDETWPRPLIRYLSGELTEAKLIGYLNSDEEGEARDGDTVDETPEARTYLTSRRLCQALFYVGEAHWARGDTALARDYLAAAINLKAFDLPEHQLARAEISKLR